MIHLILFANLASLENWNEVLILHMAHDKKLHWQRYTLMPVVRSILIHMMVRCNERVSTLGLWMLRVRGTDM